MGLEEHNRTFGQRNLFFFYNAVVAFCVSARFFDLHDLPQAQQKVLRLGQPSSQPYAITQNRTEQTSRTIVLPLVILETSKQRHRNTYLLIKRGGEVGFNSASQNIQFIWKVFQLISDRSFKILPHRACNSSYLFRRAFCECVEQVLKHTKHHRQKFSKCFKIFFGDVACGGETRLINCSSVLLLINVYGGFHL